MSSDGVITGWVWVFASDPWRSKRFSAMSSVYETDQFHVAAADGAAEDGPGPEPELVTHVTAVLGALGIAGNWRAYPLWDGEGPDYPTWEQWSTEPGGAFARLAAAAALPRIEGALLHYVHDNRCEQACRQDFVNGLEYLNGAIRNTRSAPPEGFDGG